MKSSDTLTISGVITPNSKEPSSITIEGENIIEIKKSVNQGLQFEEAIAFPGLFNMHDHLSFNLFPTLYSKRGGHSNYLEWSEYIHKNYHQLISSINAVPIVERTAVGELKNLLCGFTTVCNHHFSTTTLNVLDNIQDFAFIHSTQRHKRLFMKLVLAFVKSVPIMLHINEGYGNSVEYEIQSFKNWKFARKKIIGIHGISIPKEHLGLLDSLIWCPLSNLTLYGKTAPIKDALGQMPVFFGSDSTLSGDANIWNHVRSGIDILGDVEPLYNMLTSGPSSYFKSQKQKGSLNKGKLADIVIAKKKASSFYNAFYETNPSDILLIIKNGRIIFSKVPLENHSLTKIRAFQNTGYIIPKLVNAVSSKTLSLSPFELNIL